MSSAATWDEPDELLDEQAAAEGLAPNGHGLRRPIPITPEDPGTERALLAACLLSADALTTAIAAGITAAAFHTPRHARTWGACRALHDTGTAVDPNTVLDQLRTSGDHDTTLAELVDLQADAPGTTNAGDHAAILLRYQQRRTAIALAETLKHTARTGDGDLDAALAAADQVRHVTPAGTDRLRGYGMTELLDTDLSLSWLVRGVLTDPTYGQIAGELKTLKSHLATILAASVASGLPYLGRFNLDSAHPVTILVGEGGRIPFVRRLTGICRTMGIDDPQDLPLRAVFEVAPIGSDRFRATIDDELNHGARLVLVDPFYAFHGTTVNSANLHEEGSLLTSLSNPCTEAGATLLVVNHFNQTGTGSGLKRITQAGSGEWVDSWMLTRHRQDPDVANGDFHLEIQIGSRQWGGSTWDLDIHLGRLDPDTGQHSGDPTWTVTPTDRTARDTEATDERRQRILDAVHEHPGQLIREELARAAGGKIETARKLVDRMAEQGLIQMRHEDRQATDGRRIKSWVFHPTTPTRTPQDVEDDAA